MESEPERFRPSARTRLDDVRCELLISVATVMEISIKYSIGKLSLHIPPSELIPIMLGRERVSVLPLEVSHAVRLSVLPFHHRDPFDRMLVAQAQIDGLPVLTADPRFKDYGVQVLRA